MTAAPDAAGQLVATCGSLPLAIRIAGARLAARPSWDLSYLADQIADQRTRLSALSAGGLAVRASFSVSYNALPEIAQRAFRLISLLGPSDFAEWVIAALLGQTGAPVPTELLIDKCILTALGIDRTGQPRYILHDLLRDYAAEQLRICDNDAPQEALERVIVGWSELACYGSRRLRPDIYYPPLARVRSDTIVHRELARRVTTDPLAWFDAERANLYHMTERACAMGMLGLANQLIAFQSAYQFYQGRHNDHELLVNMLADTAAAMGDERALADANLRKAGLTAHRGNYAKAAPEFRRIIANLERESHLPLLACASYWYAYCSLKAGEIATALNAAGKALSIARRLGDAETIIMARRVRTDAYLQAGDPRSATSEIQHAILAAQKLPDPHFHLFMLRVAAHAAIQGGRWKRAMRLCNEGSSLARQSDQITDGAHFTCLLGIVYHRLNEQTRAVECLGEAAAVFRTRRNTRAEARCKLALAHVYQAIGECHRSGDYADECLPIFHQLDLAIYERQAVEILEWCHSVSGS